MSASVSQTMPASIVVTITGGLVSDIKVGGNSIQAGPINVTLPTPNAGMTIGEITVVMSDGSQFAGTISVANQSGGKCPYVVTNNGRLPCDLAVGEESVVATTYALNFQTAA